jgi:Lipocalin-like domain
MDRPQANDREAAALFLGAWLLVSYEHVLPSGEVLRPFGDSPSGMLSYQEGDHMSVHISVGCPARLSSENFFQVSAEDAAKAWGTYFGYWGSFRVDTEKNVIVHRVEGCSFPNWIGTEQVRNFRFNGANRLILETESSAGRFTVTWQRKTDGTVPRES